MLLRSRAAGVLVAMLLAGCSERAGIFPGGSISARASAVHTVCGNAATTTPGIDVSKYQEEVDWAAVKSAGQVFAIIRVSDGTTHPDGFFAQNWAKTKSAGLLRGSYQYFRPSQDPIAQADLVVDEINKAGGLQNTDLPPVLDLETTSGLETAAVLQKVDAWLARVTERTGRIPIIYTGSYFWDDNKFGSKYADFALWTAHYTEKSCPLVPDPWSSWRLWQFTDKGKVSGVTGDVDMNRFDGDRAALEAFIVASHVTPPEADASVLRDAGPDTATLDGGAVRVDADDPDDLSATDLSDNQANDDDLQGGCSMSRLPELDGSVVVLLLLVCAVFVRNKATLLVIVGALVGSSTARAGAPAPSVHIDVWSQIPLGAPIRVELRSTMASLPLKKLQRTLQVHRDNKQVAGRWVVDLQAHIICGSRLRLAFEPKQPLRAGDYQVVGVAKLQLSRLLARRFYPVRVRSTADTRPPKFRGLHTATCTRVNPLLGCRPYGITLLSQHPPQDDSRTRFVTYYRKRGQPYRKAGRFEAEIIPFAGPTAKLPRGRYIFTMRAADAADNEGGRICEVQLRFPLRGCAMFPKNRKQLRRSSGIRALCARRDSKGRSISAIDGVALTFPR